MITVDELKQALPVHLKGSASQDLADKINQATTDPELARTIKDNFVSWTTVLTEGRFRPEDYVNAVAYVSLKMMGHTNQNAYKMTFPVRYQTLVARGADEKAISAYVAAYHKNKLVTLLLEQSLVPTWILNADIYQEAVNTQFRLMQTANSEKVQCEAANSILTHLKRPETKKIEIDMGVADNSGMNELRTMMEALAQRQMDLIAQGVNTREIAHQPIDGVMKDVTPEEQPEASAKKTS